MKKKIVCLIVCLIVSPVYAVDIKGLYEAEIPVYSQKKSERRQATRDGLLEVLIKISGISEIPFTPGIPEVLNKSSKYVQQWRFRNWPAGRPYPETEDVSTADGASNKPSGKTSAREPKKVLWVRYDKQAINRILQEQGLPIWGRSRPAVLVWLAIDDGNGNDERYILSDDNNDQLKSLFTLEAARRGVPVIFPLMDLQDEVNIRVLDVWADFQEQILNASERYQTKAVLSGRLFRDEYDGWQAKWTLYEGSDVLTWDSASSNQSRILGDAIDGTASALSVRYAQIVHETADDAMFISVMDIHDLADHARVIKYLESLASVSQASAVKFDAANTIYRLDIKGAEQGVVKAIELGNTLMSSQIDFMPVDSQVSMQSQQVYRLLR